MKPPLAQHLLTEITTDTRTLEPVSQKPYPITMKHYQWVKDEIENLHTAKQQK